MQALASVSVSWRNEAGGLYTALGHVNKSFGVGGEKELSINQPDKGKKF